MRLKIVLSLHGSCVTHTSVTCVLSMPCAADQTGQYVCQLLEPAFSTVPVAADIQTLFQSALQSSGTLPFPVPDVFYWAQRMQDEDMKHYLAPVSESGAMAFSSSVHSVLHKQFPAGTGMVPKGLLLSRMFGLLACARCGRQVMQATPVLCSSD